MGVIENERANSRVYGLAPLCADYDCETKWTEWTECNAECGYGRRYRYAEITQYPAGKGASFPFCLFHALKS